MEIERKRTGGKSRSRGKKWSEIGARMEKRTYVIACDERRVVDG
jgi:hypothetical protein